MKISYIPGFKLENSLFKFSNGIASKIVRVTSILSDELITEIKSGKGSPTPEEVIDLLKEKFPTIHSVSRHLRQVSQKPVTSVKQDGINPIRVLKVENRGNLDKPALEKKADYIQALNPNEITPPVAAKELEKALDPKEVTADENKIEKVPTTDSGAKVKELFNRLPDTAPGAQTQALNPNEVKVTANKEVSDLLVKLSEKEKELETIKQNELVKQTAAAKEEVISLLKSSITDINEEDIKKYNLDSMTLEELSKIKSSLSITLEKMQKKASIDITNLVDGSNVIQAQETITDVGDVITVMSKNWNKVKKG